MIWILMGILVLAGLLYVTLPLYIKTFGAPAAGNELTDYAQEIANIDAQLAAGEGDAETLKQTRTELARQLLASDKKTDGARGPHTLTLMVLFAVFCFGTLGIYSQVGTPELAKFKEKKSMHAPVQSAGGSMEKKSMEDLVVQLEQRLIAEPNNAEGWMLYANSLMHLQRYDEAIAAFERVLVLTDDNPIAVEEYARAKAFIAQQRGGVSSTPSSTSRSPSRSMTSRAPGPSAADMDAAAQMSPEDRMAMIEGMVEGLLGFFAHVLRIAAKLFLQVFLESWILHDLPGRVTVGL